MTSEGDPTSAVEVPLLAAARAVGMSPDTLRARLRRGTPLPPGVTWRMDERGRYWLFVPREALRDEQDEWRRRAEIAEAKLEASQEIIRTLKAVIRDLSGR